MAKNQEKKQCKGINKDGIQCKKAPCRGSDFCANHQEEGGHYLNKPKELIADELIKYVDNIGDEFPSIAGFLLHLRKEKGIDTIARGTYYKWIKENGDHYDEYFALAHEYLCNYRMHTLENKCLKNKYNANFGKFILQSQHDYIEKAEEKEAEDSEQVVIVDDI